jgi:hypothetical protein
METQTLFYDNEIGHSHFAHSSCSHKIFIKGDYEYKQTFTCKYCKELYCSMCYGEEKREGSVCFVHKPFYHRSKNSSGQIKMYGYPDQNVYAEALYIADQGINVIVEPKRSS